MGRIADLVILNLLFLITVLPVVTAGAALCAIHDTRRKIGEGTEGFVPRTYIRSLIRRFKSSLPGSLLLLAVGSLLLFDITIGADMLSPFWQKLTLPVIGALLLLWLFIFAWYFPAFDEVKSRPFAGLPAALLLAVRHLPRTLLMALLTVFPLAAYHFWIRFFLGILLPFYVVIGFSLSAMLCGLLSGQLSIGSGKLLDSSADG